MNSDSMNRYAPNWVMSGFVAAWRPNNQNTARSPHRKRWTGK